MSGPSILVVGAGSIGRRHARNLSELGADVWITDIDAGAARSLAPEVPATPFDTWSSLDPDGIVLATPTVHHARHLEEALSSCDRVLVEKPLVAHPSDLRVIRGHEDHVMVGHNLRFHQPLQMLREVIDSERLGATVAGRLWFGFHLPDWRPGTDYHQSYSARSELGGGVLLDAIHELDLALWFFGNLAVESAFMGSLGELEIDVEDTVRALLITDEGAPVEIALDYLSRRYRRGVEVIGTMGSASFDWDRGTLDVDTAEARESTQVNVSVDHAYRLEVAAFASWVEGRCKAPVSAAAGAASVRLAHAIREASA